LTTSPCSLQMRARPGDHSQQTAGPPATTFPKAASRGHAEMFHKIMLQLVLCGVLATGFSVAGRAQAQQESLLYRHLQGQAVASLKARSEARLGLKTAEAAQKQSAQVRQWLKAALGPWPEKTPLNAKVTGAVAGAGVRVENVLFESRPGHHVTANFYMPATPPPWPGVIVPCGHSANGKAAETYQRAAILLARSGMAALCYDPIGQGERVQALKPDGKPLFAGSTTEHTRIANGSLAVGLQTAHYRVWDGIRALDYLESRPEIDKNRLGCTGNSGGGTLTSFLMAVDDRIQAAAASCYLTTYERLLETIGPQDAEQNISGMIAAGLDHGDFILARLPKPTLMCVATRDFFDITGAWQTFREAKKLYGAAGFGERVDLFEFDDTHGFSSPRRVAAVRWLRRWLLDKNDAVTDADFPIFTDAQLQVTHMGQVLNESGEKSVFQLNRETAEKITAGREQKKSQSLKSAIRNRLHLGQPVKAAVMRPGHLIGGRLQQVYYTTADGFELAGVKCIYRDGVIQHWAPLQNELPATVIIGAGKPSGQMAPDELKIMIDELKSRRVDVSDGIVVLLDLRGTGSSGAPLKKSNDPNGPDWREAELARLLNQNLVGLRTSDLLSVVNYEAQSSKNLGVVALGRSVIPGLLASTYADTIKRFAELDGPESWLGEISRADSKLHLADIVPGVLADFDLPDLRRLINTKLK